MNFPIQIDSSIINQISKENVRDVFNQCRGICCMCLSLGAPIASEGTNYESGLRLERINNQAEDFSLDNLVCLCYAHSSEQGFNEFEISHAKRMMSFDETTGVKVAVRLEGEFSSYSSESKDAEALNEFLHQSQEGEVELRYLDKDEGSVILKFHMTWKSYNTLKGTDRGILSNVFDRQVKEVALVEDEKLVKLVRLLQDLIDDFSSHEGLDIEKYEAANACADSIIERFPRSSLGWSGKAIASIVAYRKLDQGSAQREKIDKAFEYACHALELSPNAAVNWTNKAIVLHEIGRKDDARNLARKAVELEPGSGDAWYNLGVILLHQNAIAGAGEAFVEAARLGHKGAALALSDVAPRARLH